MLVGDADAVHGARMPCRSGFAKQRQGRGSVAGFELDTAEFKLKSRVIRFRGGGGAARRESRRDIDGPEFMPDDPSGREGSIGEAANRSQTAVAVPYSSELREMALAHTIGNKADAAYRRGDALDSAGR